MMTGISNEVKLEKTGFPGVVGAIYGTYIQIIRPNQNEHLFFNRKLKHSINAMVASKAL